MKLSEFLHPLRSALDSFLREVPSKTTHAPFVRDAVDTKRWMMLVVVSLFPCLFVAIWNAGLQSIVYSSGDFRLLEEYLSASTSWEGYWHFAFPRWSSIIQEGLIIVLPLVFVSYAVGGFWEALFATIRRHEIAEGFLVSGLLYPLILPPTLPLWMAALGISVGIVLGKELFGGAGMNILNPALTCRAFLYFSFPAYMTGEVWAGRSAPFVRESLIRMNLAASKSPIDGFSQPSALSLFNVADEVKRIHVDAIASREWGQPVATADVIQRHFDQWNSLETAVGSRSLSDFLQQGLGLSGDGVVAARAFAKLKYGMGIWSDGNLVLGNKLGSLGEVSILACLLGALFLLIVGIASWRTMTAVVIGAACTALAFEWGSRLFGIDGGAWNPANFDFPAYKHFLMGGLTFGLIFMATDPVSSPTMNSAKWAYGFLIGMLTIIIRNANPAYPEGVMLAILFGNVFAPLFDTWALKWYRRRHVA